MRRPIDECDLEDCELGFTHKRSDHLPPPDRVEDSQDPRQLGLGDLGAAGSGTRFEITTLGRKALDDGETS